MMNPIPFANSIPAIVRVMIVFVIIVGLIHKKWSLGNTFFIGSLILGLIFNMNFGAMGMSIFHSITTPKTVALAMVVFLILVLSLTMEKTGQMERLLNNFKGILSWPKLNLIIFPALIGLLPMPGGAVFSAPMVGQLGKDSHLSGDQLSFINYWFRHIWEYWWPLYPGVLLAIVLADIPLAGFMILMFPMTLVALGLGFRRMRAYHQTAPQVLSKPSVKPFVHELVPILIVIVPGLVLGYVFSMVMPNSSINKEAGLICSLIVALTWGWYQNQVPMGKIKSMVWNGKNLSMIYMIAGILVFKGMLEDSQAVTAITDELVLMKIPLVLIVMVLPFLVGMVTGITIAFVGSTFPIIIPLIHTLAPSANLMPFMMLAMGCGFAGVMMSPVHLCFILSNEYFETTMTQVYRHLTMPCMALMGTCLAYHWILRSTMF